MRTMNTQRVAQWLDNQGMIAASKSFLSTFGHMDKVDCEGIEAFFNMTYGESDGFIYRHMQCNVTTTMTFDLTDQLN